MPLLHRMESKSKASKERPTCPVCRSSKTQTMVSLESDVDGKEYHAVECNSCGLWFASPLPALSFNALQEIYGSDYTEDQRGPVSDDRTKHAIHDATNRQMDIVEEYVRKGTALNVGAMSDATRVLAARGWDVKVVEVSRYAAETARERWGIEATVSKLEDFDCPPETFSFVKLGHVIEHLADPGLALRRLAAALEGGGIVLIDTDNAHSLRTRVEVGVRRVLGERPSTWLVGRLTKKNLRKRYGRLAPPVHLYTFSEQNLTMLLKGAGFEVLCVFKPAWGDPTWFPLTNKSDLSLLERAFIRLDQVGAKFGAGEVIAVLARKR